MFSDHFAFPLHALVNFVGGGGKTALIGRLMEEYHSQGTVLCTTTTRIHPPEAGEGSAVLASDNIPLLRMMVEAIVRNCSGRFYMLTVTRYYLSPTLLRGVPEDFCSSFNRDSFSILLNEADGAAGYSIKMPREGEPLLMENAQYLVPVIGIDCLNKKLGPEVLFRWQGFISRNPHRNGECITPEVAAEILMHPEGVCKGWKPGMQIVPFINKADSPVDDSAARDLAQAIFRNGSFPVHRVVYGSVLHGRVDSITLS